MSTEASRLFDRWAEAGRGDAMARGHWPMVSQILDRMGLGSGMHCLDVGCGNGYAVRAMAARVGGDGFVMGVDVSPAMVAEAERADLNPANVRFKVAPAEALPFTDSHFDRVLSVEAIYYLGDPLRALQEWRRVLKPGGSAWIMVDFYEENPYSRIWDDLIELPMHYYSEAQYRDLLTRAGFVKVFSDRVFNPEPVDAANFKPGWGYDTVEDVRHFRTRIGSLLVSGEKP